MSLTFWRDSRSTRSCLSDLQFLVVGLFWLVVVLTKTTCGDEPPGQSAIEQRGSLPILLKPQQGKIGRSVFESDRARYPRPIKPPAGAPNVVVVVLDDCGFGQFSVFGGGVPSPHLERLAATGLRYNRFHTTALCSPTRAALLTGRNHHVAGTGIITELATGYDGYTGLIPRTTATIGEILRQNGYATAWFGKNHNTPEWETSAAGPFDHWPNGLGFDYFYGFLGGDAHQWLPTLFENTAAVSSPLAQGLHLTTDLTDRSIQWVRKVKSIDPSKPFFLYYCPGATHAPHHAPQEWIQRFKGQFDGGWDRYRESTFARQKQLGVIPADARLTPRPATLSAWNSLPDGERRVCARMMEVYAAYGAHTDHELGRLFEALRQLPDADNTLIVCLCGDNGASAEGGPAGMLNSIAFFNEIHTPWQISEKHLDELGGPNWYNHLPAAWGWAMNTPFQWTKQVASHLGGTRTPLIISWPRRIRDRGGLRSQFHHVIDIAPTILEATGIPEPNIVNGVAQRRIDGISMVYSFDSVDAAERHKTQYFEIFGNRAMYRDGWLASCMTFEPWTLFREGFQVDLAPWELYNLDADYSQSENLAALYPDKLHQLQDLWWAEAGRNEVLPLDWRALGRINPRDRPSSTADRTTFTFYPGMIRLPEGSSPITKNRSFSISADVVIPPTGAEGILITEGGVTGGYAFYVQNQRLVFTYNWAGLERTTVTSRSVLTPGPGKLEVHFDYEGWFGRGGLITLMINGEPQGEVRLNRSIAERYAASEGLDVGEDGGSPVDFGYQTPFRFTGRLEQVQVKLGFLDEARLGRQILLEGLISQLETDIKQSLERLTNVNVADQQGLRARIERLTASLDTAHERLWDVLQARIKNVHAAREQHQTAKPLSSGSPMRDPILAARRGLEFQKLIDDLRSTLNENLQSKLKAVNLEISDLESRQQLATGDVLQQIKARLESSRSRRDTIQKRLEQLSPADK